MTFFRNFGKKILYPVNGINNRPIEITNFFRYVRTIPQYLDSIIDYQLYDIMDGERPDQISYGLYDTPYYHWTFFLINDSLKDSVMSSWPMGYNDFQKMVSKKYNGSSLETQPSVTLDGAGNPIDFPNSITGKFDIGINSNPIRERSVVNGFVGGYTGNEATLIGKKSDVQQLVYKINAGSPSQFIEGNLIEQQQTGTTNIYSVIISKLYQKYENAPHHFEDTNGVTRVNSKFIVGGGYSSLTPITNREWEYKRNETNRKIKVVEKKYIKLFSDTFRELIRNDIGMNRI